MNYHLRAIELKYRIDGKRNFHDAFHQVYEVALFFDSKQRQSYVLGFPELSEQVLLQTRAKDRSNFLSLVLNTLISVLDLSYYYFTSYGTTFFCGRVSI